MNHKCNRLLAWTLAAALLFTGPVYAEEDAAPAAAGLCEHHTEHGDDCGYQEAVPQKSCAYVCEFCGQKEEEKNTDPENTADAGRDQGEADTPEEDTDMISDTDTEPAKDTAKEQTPANAASRTEDTESGMKDTESESEGIESKTEDTESEPEEGKQPDHKTIHTWSWIDEDKNLTEGILYLSGAREEDPILLDAVLERLPGEILAKMKDEEDGETVTLAAWNCEEYPEDGAYEGSYTLAVELPEGYILSEEAEALEVTVVFEETAEAAPAALAEEADKLSVLSDSEGTFKEEDGALYYYQPLNITIVSGPNTWSNYSLKYRLDSAAQSAVLTKIDGPAHLFTGDEKLDILEKITYQGIEYTVTTIGEEAFKYGKLKNILLPETITRIERLAFDHCEAAETINIPENVTYIGYGAFNMCVKLQEITIPNGVTEIPGSAFSACHALSKLTIPENVTTIGDSAFSTAGIYSGTPMDLVIPNRVVSIGLMAFHNANLRSITFPAGRTEELVVDYSFASCKNLETVNIFSEMVKTTPTEFKGSDKSTLVYYPSTGTQPIELTTKVRYSVNTDGKTATILNVLGTALSQTPQKIGDWYVSAVPESYQPQGKHVCYFGENECFYYCTICKTANANHTHQWDTEYTVDREATCTRNGQKSKHCKTCDQISDVSTIPASHSLTYSKKQEPTCTEKGTQEHWNCSVCGKNFSDEDGKNGMADVTIAATGHCMTHYEKIAPTCIENGQAEYWNCSVCGKNFSDDAGAEELADTVLTATGHTMTYHEKTEPTCLTDGHVEYWSCSACGKNFADKEGAEVLMDLVIPMKGHVYGTEWKSDRENHWHVCVCGDKKEVAAHTFQWTADENAVADKKGSIYEECSVCGYRKSEAQELPEHPQDTEEIQFKLIMEPGIPDIPQSLAEKGLDTSEKIEFALKTEITRKETSFAGGNTALYDVTLLVRRQGNSMWEVADASNFPSDGKLRVILPYPEETGRETHDFLAAHMFTTSDFGRTPGEIELLQVTKTEEGLCFNVTGLSPVLLSWREIPTPAPDDGQKPQGPSDENGNNSSGGNGNSSGNSGSSSGNSGSSSSGSGSSSGNSGSSSSGSGSSSGNNSSSSSGSGSSSGNSGFSGQGGNSAGLPVQSAGTGDHHNPEAWFLLLFLSGGGINLLLKRKKHPSKSDITSI